MTYFQAPERPAYRPRRRTNRRWIPWAAGAAVLLIVGGGVFVSLVSIPTPATAIEDRYTRAADLDEDDGKAYTSPDDPETVAAAIAAEAEPLGRRHSDGVHYLRYTHHVVAVYPHNNGSRVLLDDYRSGAQRHATVFALWGWSPSPPPPPIRGGGPGSGK